MRITLAPAWCPRIRRLPLVAALLVGLAAITLGALRAADAHAAFPYGESFQDAAAPGFQLGGAATLTAAGSGPDAPGSGWLRLTPSVNNAFGYAYNQTAFPSAQGISYEFDYAAWGGSGADGLAFVLFDGATTDAEFEAGPPGGALGYTRCFMDGAWQNGLTNAYMALGFDVFGNFANSGVCQQSGLPQALPNHITVRGGAPDYAYKASVAATGGVGTGNRAGARRVTVTVLPKNGQTVLTASVRSPNGAVQQIADELVLPNPPPTLKFGFTASTGGFNNNHEIRGIHVTKPTDLQVEVEPDEPLADRDATQAYTATITNAGPNPATGVDVTASMPDTEDIEWICTAAGGATCLPMSGVGLPDGSVGALPVGGTLSYRITGKLDAGADDSTLTFAAAPTGDTSEMAPADNAADGQTDVTPLLDAAPSYVVSSGGLATATSGGPGRGGHLQRGWQWYRCEADGDDCRAIAGATSATHQTTIADRDHNLRVRETLTNGAGAAFADSATWTLPDTTILTSPPATTALPSHFTFAATTPGATFECRRDGATVWTACASPLTLSGLSDGSHTARVRAVFGNLSDPTPATYVWTVDTTTHVSIVNPLAGTTSNASPTVAITGEPGASWVLRHDGTAIDSGVFDGAGRARSTALGTLADGRHELRVDATDAVRNVAHDRVTLLVATQDPVAPTTGTNALAAAVGILDPARIASPGVAPPALAGTPARGPEPTTVKTRVADRSSVSASNGTVRVGCALDRGTLDRCPVRIYERRSNGKRGALIGRGTVRSTADGRSGATDVRLNARGRRAVTRSRSGRRAIVSSVATARGGKRLRAKAVRTTLVPQRRVTVPTARPSSNDGGVVRGPTRRVIDDVAPQLRRATSIRCIGHTDDRGSTARNHTLGLRQAQAVCRTLRRMGVRGKLRSSSRGEDRPRASNETAAGRAENRRVELVVGY